MNPQLEMLKYMKMNAHLICIYMAVGLLFSCSGGEQKAEAKSDPPPNKAPVEQNDPEPANENLVSETGLKVYNQYCVVCHQADGQGVPNAFPPLIQTDWVLGDKERLIGVVLNGLSGEIEVNGETYNSAMVAHDFLTDEEIAAVITYVRSSFGNDADGVTAEEVAAVRASG